jgi:hypothetical protein
MEKFLQIYLTIPSTSNTIFLRSEYIKIYPDKFNDILVDNTIVIRCLNNENEFDYLFIDKNGNSTGEILIRVEGGFKSEGYKFADHLQMTLNLLNKPIIIQSIPPNIHRLTIGDDFGVPNWIIDKLNRMFSCSTVKIDGVKYCRNESAKFEKVNLNRDYYSGVWVIDLVQD